MQDFGYYPTNPRLNELVQTLSSYSLEEIFQALSFHPQRFEDLTKSGSNVSTVQPPNIQCVIIPAPAESKAEMDSHQVIEEAETVYYPNSKQCVEQRPQAGGKPKIIVPIVQRPMMPILPKQMKIRMSKQM
mmetsp:Transcript_18982/g.21820  ORF Transcript_18982/g.21820 Transcript_18982/m.21820 type:complete len:131 (-) Transcript_18982:48-440(-)